ncbi:MAG: metallophosphoesterase family protein [Acidobacteria bacterium]|nr:metallophosphoesterase family protein [Acidobacteriota bacterium]
MRYLLISDIHANLQALEAVLEDAARIGYDAALCLGDLVGYGADPAGVIQRIDALRPAAIVRGNHDKVCAGLEPPTLFNDAARQSAEWTFATLSAGERERLARLPKGPASVEGSVEICHGAPFDEDYYVFTENDASRAIDAATVPLCLFGHTHVPAIFSSADDPVVHDNGTPAGELRLPRAGPALINVGSVGQPRDGDPRAAYGIVDVAKRVLQLRRVDYDVKEAQRRIRAAGLPEWLAVRLGRGQ